jgi:hypothetical protein
MKQTKMKVLVACEFSGVVREAFRNLGYNAWSCDLLDSEILGKHIKGDVLQNLGYGWDLMIAFPPCTYLTLTGNRWFKPEFTSRFPDRPKHREEAIIFFKTLANCNIPKIAIENPIGVMSSVYRKPDQIIQPFMFGDPEKKTTCLWLKNLPKLRPTKIVEPQLYTYKSNGKKDPKWHVDSMRLPPLERMKARSRTFQGIADAMASQWGSHLLACNREVTQK